MIDYFVIEPCNTANALEIKLRGRRIDLPKAQKAFSTVGEVMATTPVVMLTKVKDYSISVYASGRMIVKGKKKLGKKEVEELAYGLLDALEKNNAVVEVERK